MGVAERKLRELRLRLEEEKLVDEEAVVGLLADARKSCHDLVLILQVTSKSRLLQVVVRQLERLRAQLPASFRLQVLDLDVTDGRSECVGFLLVLKRLALH